MRGGAGVRERAHRLRARVGEAVAPEDGHSQRRTGSRAHSATLPVVALEWTLAAYKRSRVNRSRPTRPALAASPVPSFAPGLDLISFCAETCCPGLWLGAAAVPYSLGVQQAGPGRFVSVAVMFAR